MVDTEPDRLNILLNIYIHFLLQRGVKWEYMEGGVYGMGVPWHTGKRVRGYTSGEANKGGRATGPTFLYSIVWPPLHRVNIFIAKKKTPMMH